MQLCNVAFFGAQPVVQHRLDRGTADLCVRPPVPGDRQGIQRALGLPPGIGDDGDGILADADDLAHAGHVQYPCVIERCQPAIECGACLDRGIEPMLGVETRELIRQDGRITGIAAMRVGWAASGPLGMGVI